MFPAGYLLSTSGSFASLASSNVGTLAMWAENGGSLGTQKGFTSFAINTGYLPQKEPVDHPQLASRSLAAPQRPGFLLPAPQMVATCLAIQKNASTTPRLA